MKVLTPGTRRPNTSAQDPYRVNHKAAALMSSGVIVSQQPWRRAKAFKRCCPCLTPNRYHAIVPRSEPGLPATITFAARGDKTRQLHDHFRGNEWQQVFENHQQKDADRSRFLNGPDDPVKQIPSPLWLAEAQTPPNLTGSEMLEQTMDIAVTRR